MRIDQDARTFDAYRNLASARRTNRAVEDVASPAGSEGLGTGIRRSDPGTAQHHHGHGVAHLRVASENLAASESCVRGTSGAPQVGSVRALLR